MFRTLVHAFSIVSVLTAVAAPAAAQYLGDVPWDVFQDTQSDSVCDVVNAANVELVVLSATGELVKVTGPDIIFEDTFVDLGGNVYYLGEPFGFITFDLDGDGFRTLWWESLTGRVVSVDGFTGEPSETNLFPADFVDVPCDACDFWDDQSVCTEVIVVEPEPEPGPVPIMINLCGSMGTASLALTLTGLVGLSLVRRYGC